jgi:O-antigen/teichoic acid export membrane protein
VDHPTDPSQSLAKRSITSLGWNAVSQIVAIAAGFVKSWLLARWLPVEVFGIYGFALSIVELSSVLANFGMGGAFMHHAPETADEEETAAIHFTLKLIATCIWTMLMVGGAWFALDGGNRLAVLVLTLAAAGTHVTQTPRLILMRRVKMRRLAVLAIANALITAVLVLTMAWYGATLWALLASNIVTMVLNIGFLYVWKPVWSPRLAWSPPVVRYYLRFGGTHFMSVALTYALDRIDDIWTGTFLGSVPLGYYDRAYTFATYPRAILTDPIHSVVYGTYAELKNDRRRLSETFARVNELLVRASFFLAGMIMLAAPEFIRIVLGEKWLPALNVFQLMLAFALFDPMQRTTAALFPAIGRPDKVVRVRIVQLGVLVAGLFGLGYRFEITGVALAVDAMLLVGIVLLLWQAGKYVDYSLPRLFAVPGLALLASFVLTVLSENVIDTSSSDWLSAIRKIVVHTVVYGGIILSFEHNQIAEYRTLIMRYLAPKRESEAPG